MKPATEHLTIHLLARVGDSEVLNEIATVTRDLEVEPITERTRRSGDSAEATTRMQIDMVGALRAAAAEIDKLTGREPGPVPREKIEAGIAAAIATLEDRETGAGSDLDRDIYREPDDVFVEIHGNVDLPQLVREILEAGR